MDGKWYVAIIVVALLVIGYFVFLAPKGAAGSTSSTTIITTTLPISNLTTTVNIPNPKNPANLSQLNHSWVQTNGYPLQINSPDCIAISGYVYCVGGLSNGNYTSNTYFSSISYNGIATWQQSTPIQIIPSSCVTHFGNIYCATGLLISTHAVINTTYYAEVNSSGFGNWNETTSYPVNVSSSGCAASGYIIICAGGKAGNGTLVSSVYYAAMTPSGIGQWSSTYPLPVAASPQCFAYSTSIYCLGSYVNTTGAIKNFNFYAPVSAYGIQSWKSTTPAPNGPYNYSCSLFSNILHCIGSYSHVTNSTSVYYTGLSNGGVNGWHKGTAYPIALMNGTSCVKYNATTFCFGGEDSNLTLINGVFYTTSLP